MFRQYWEEVCKNSSKKAKKTAVELVVQLLYKYLCSVTKELEFHLFLLLTNASVCTAPILPEPEPSLMLCSHRRWLSADRRELRRLSPPL